MFSDNHSRRVRAGKTNWSVGEPIMRGILQLFNFLSFLFFFAEILPRYGVNKYIYLLQNHLDASEYLARHSASNHSSFCLSYAITYRDFADKLGLAWAAINQLGK